MWPWHPPVGFDATEVAFTLMILQSLMRSSLVVSPAILDIIGVKKSATTYLTLLVAPAMISCTPFGIDSGFFLMGKLI